MNTHERAEIYVRRVTAPTFVAVAVLATIADSIVKHHSWPRRLANLGLAAVASSVFGTIRVVAGRRGLEVGFGPWGWPARRIPLDNIRSARAERFNPIFYGGWGYRIRPDGTRIILRGRHAIAVELPSGRSFGVTVPDPDRAAAVLNDTIRDAAAGA